MISNLSLIKIIFLTFLFTLIILVRGNGLLEIPNFMIRSFQSHVVMLDRIQNLVTYYDEHFDKLEMRGKLKIENDDFNETLIYSSNFILKFRENTCQQIEANNDNTFLSSWAKLGDGYLIGPFAIVTLIQIFKPNLKWDILKSETIRGIPTSVLRTYLSDSSHNLNVTLYFAIHQWDKFYSHNIKPPILMDINGTILTNTGYQRIDRKYDYLSYYENSTWQEFKQIRPIYGVGCFNVTQSKIFPTNIKENFKAVRFNLERIDEKSQNSIWLEVYEDDEYGALRYYSFVENFLTHSAVYDMKLKIVYHNEDYYCQIEHLNGEIIAISELLKNKYYYLGEDIVENVKVDVWETVNYEFTNKIVHTLFISQIQSLNPQLKSQIPMKVFYRTYDKDNKILRSVEFLFYNFEPLMVTGTYQNFFSIEDCAYGDDVKKNFKLVFNFEDKKSESLSKSHINSIKTNLTLMLSQVLNIRPLRISNLELEFESNIMIVNVVILPPTNPFWLFTHVNNNLKIYASDYSKEVTSYAECAEISIKQKSNTFYICHSYTKKSMFCIIPRNISKHSSFLTGVFCENYTSNIDNVSSLIGPSINEITDKLINQTLAKKLKFEIDLSDKDNQNVLQLSINDTIIETITNNFHSINSDFIWLSEGYKINNSGNFDSFTVEDENVHLLEDCFRACQKSQAINCMSFSFCQKANKEKCVLSGVLINFQNQSAMIESNLIVERHNESCNIFKPSFLEKYHFFNQISATVSYEKLIIDVRSVESCAELCFFADFPCKSFEFCDGNCYLRKEHFIDFFNFTIPVTECSLYSVNYMMDYYYTGKALVKNTFALIEGISTSDCASACSENKKQECVSFNYCSQTAQSPSKCLLSVYSPLDSPTEVNSFCKNYLITSSKNAPAKKTLTVIGMSEFNLFVLLIGMFNLGLILGLVGFIGYYKYQPAARIASGSFSSPILRFTNNREYGEEVNKVTVVTGS